MATLSLGAPRRFVLNPRRRDRGERHTLDLGRGSLLVMGGTCQRDYYHGVPRQPGLLGVNRLSPTRAVDWPVIEEIAQARRGSREVDHGRLFWTPQGV